MSDYNPNLQSLNIRFSALLSAYKGFQKQVMSKVNSLQCAKSAMNPMNFILIQFQMGQLTQMGESISNLISQVNTIISRSISNQKTQ